MHVRLSDDAKADLRAIFNFIATDNPAAAMRVVDGIIIAAAQLESFPLLGKKGRIEGTRELVAPRSPYILIYSIADEYHIMVERVLHGARVWPRESE